jgi:hypothetical protein
MKLVGQYQTAEAAFEGTKADVLAMVDYLKASVEGQTFQGWASAYYLRMWAIWSIRPIGF